jgi:putative superfamily III holin-X
MDDNKTAAGKLIENASDIVETSYKLLVLKVVDKATSIISSALAAVTFFVIGFFVILFLGIGTAIWIGEAMNNVKAGYFITGGIFLFIILIVYLLRKQIIFPLLKDSIIKKFYEPADKKL